jgi:hypothetical protein
MDDVNDLVLGWALTSNMMPSFWVPGAKPGQQNPGHLIMASAKSMAYHTVIVAQSGSGKSFFLGRLLEELALKTRGRVLILDPNADFRRMSDVVPEPWWDTAAYDPTSGNGRLPHEASRAVFEPRWKKMKPQVLSGPYSKPTNSEQLRVSWNAFPIAVLAEELDAIPRSQLYHCHEFVKSVAIMEGARRRIEKKEKNKTEQNPYPFDKAQKLLQRARHEGARTTIEEEFGPAPKMPEIGGALWKTIWEFWVKARHSQARERAISAVEFISPEIEKFYFGRAKEYVAEEIVSSDLADESQQLNQKIQIIDLPSFKNPRTQHIVLSSVVEAAWNHARQEWAVAFEKDASSDDRVPLFIVVEEAHNIVPQDELSVSAEALRNQFRTIAAEGRKYGVFLILCTQRPDKIDKTIVSECENRAVMKMGSVSVLGRTKELLGLEHISDDQLRKCLTFQIGKFLITGPWTGEEDFLFGYSAMRRTVEGGRNLRREHWAVPEPTGSSEDQTSTAPAMEGKSKNAEVKSAKTANMKKKRKHNPKRTVELYN